MNKRYNEDTAHDINTIINNKKKIRKILIEPPTTSLEYDIDEPDDAVIINDEEVLEQEFCGNSAAGIVSYEDPFEDDPYDEDLYEQEDFSIEDEDPNMNAGASISPYENAYGGNGMMSMAYPGTGNTQNTPGTADELGRFYELKKIHERLTAIEKYLSDENNNKLLIVRKYVSEALDLFDLVMSNFMKFQDTIDEIIIKFYRFISSVYKIIYKHYKEQADDNSDNKDKNNK